MAPEDKAGAILEDHVQERRYVATLKQLRGQVGRSAVTYFDRNVSVASPLPCHNSRATILVTERFEGAPKPLHFAVGKTVPLPVFINSFSISIRALKLYQK
jgi:hypothetical protein